MTDQQVLEPEQRSAYAKPLGSRPAAHRRRRPDHGEPQSRDLRNASLCAMAVVAALLLTLPLADLSFDDDWSYAFSVKRLMETGHLLYNGWSSPMLISQAYWGLAWCRIFGFSFTVLRLSMMPLAAGVVAASHLLTRRCGLTPSAAVFVALLLGLSPLFLPLAASFMNDVPGCLGMVVSLYGFVRCLQARRWESAGWLVFGVITAVIGGLSRQCVWIVPLSVLPLVAWRRRREWWMVAASAAAWLGVLLAAVMLQHWFDRQPYAIPEPSFHSVLACAEKDPLSLVIRFANLLLTLMLVLLPAGLTVLWRLRSRRIVGLTAAVLILLIGCLSRRPRLEVAPWMDNIMEPVGVLGNLQVPGERPLVLRYPILPALSIAIFVSTSAMIALGLAWLAAVNPRQCANRLLHPDSEQAAILAVLLVAGSYLLTLSTRCALNFSYDRHLLPLIPLGGIVLLRSLRVGSAELPIPRVAWLLLALFGIFAVASTQEDLALARARATAAQRLTDARIPRAQISGGLEYDYWTQLLTTGCINDSRIKNPPGAYHPNQGDTPSVHPLFRLEYQPAADSVPSDFGTVNYFSFLPPFQRRICIDRIVAR